MTSEISPDEERWANIGGVMARAFVDVGKLFTTPRSGPPMGTIQRRGLRNLGTGKLIDDCVPDNTLPRTLSGGSR